MTGLLPLAERKRQIATHPRVRFHPQPTQCTALTTSRLSTGAYCHPDPATRAAKQEKARCRSRAYWKFRPLKSNRDGDESGDYCWNHLFSQGFGGMQEWYALEKWWTRKYGKGQK